MARLLVIEDNQDLAFGLSRVLDFEGYDVSLASTGTEGVERATELDPDLIILDLMLPEMSGYDVLRALRTAGVRTPVLILSARSEEVDVLMGFDSGADDYVTKPFSTPELLARVRALLRRVPGDSGKESELATVERFGDVTVNMASRTVELAGEPVTVTPKEFDLLVALLARRGAVASRKELLSEVWRYDNADVMTRTVDVHIGELRRKLEADPAKPRHIITVRKAGYRLQD
jgi:two-component system alkaline phosphatase synthesis response regulator PhoP